MKALKIVIFMLILFISVGAVCAADTDCDDILSDESPDTLKNTFTDLQNNISDASDVFEINDDYTFNNETDLKSGILIDKHNFTINGNNHVLDGNGQSRIFNITGNNITINNLVFINGNYTRGAAIYTKGQITLNNVTFANNIAETYGGAVDSRNGIVNCNNSRFIDNYAESGSALFANNVALNIQNTFITSSIPNKRGQVYVRASNVAVDNLDFVNISSTYAPAIYLDSSNDLRAINSRFINLTANMTAGAIAVKGKGNVYIKGCEFINTKSFKNAGAINVDYKTDDEYLVRIYDTLFYNASSMIGGAYIQLGGKLSLVDSSFISNGAIHDGGALYLAFVNGTINGCTFDSNVVEEFEDYPSQGGAIYSDYNELRISKSTFINNSASIGGGIYACDTNYRVVNSTFVNNTHAIYTDFDKKSFLENNTYNDDIVITNQTFYYVPYVDSSALELELVNNTINVTSLPTRFDLREWGWVSSVKNQGRMGSCWTFGMMGALESALLEAYGIEFDLSEGNLFHNLLRYFGYGYLDEVEGGWPVFASSYLVGWFGPALESTDVYDEVGKLSPFLTSGYDVVHIQDVKFVSYTDRPDGTQLKTAILTYGSMEACYFAASTADGGYYNPETFAHYVNESLSVNHAISVVGWDDNFSKDKFLVTPPGDGAWIIKNSWGTDFGDEGFLYISYYDKTFVPRADITREALAIVVENTVPYNKNYQHDFTWEAIFKNITELKGDNGTIAYMNGFVAADDDLIAAVGTYFNDSDVEYTVEIYVNDELKLVQQGVSPFKGFHTIKLNEYVPIKEGDYFYAVLTSNTMPVINCSNSRVHYSANQSFYYYNGEWIDLYSTENNIACLKIYTVDDDSKVINNKDISVDYSGGSYFSVNVVTDDGHAVIAASVKFTINGKTTTVVTDGNGIAKIKITDIPGQYAIKTSYNGKTYVNKVTVKQVLTTSKVTVKKTAKSFNLQAKLKINGKLVKGKKITFKFRGKNYKATTNAKGIAKVTIKQDVIKKLKKGKTYTFKVTYLKDTIKSTVKVR